MSPALVLIEQLQAGAFIELGLHLAGEHVAGFRLAPEAQNVPINILEDARRRVRDRVIPDGTLGLAEIGRRLDCPEIAGRLGLAVALAMACDVVGSMQAVELCRLSLGPGAHGRPSFNSDSTADGPVIVWISTGIRLRSPRHRPAIICTFKQSGKGLQVKRLPEQAEPPGVSNMQFHNLRYTRVT